ncbi:hypothetical protein [Advenella kashmirensis]|nr:hypothetical protein [Advenella kashmirensis]
MAQQDDNEAVWDILKRLIELGAEGLAEKLVFENINTGCNEAA